MVSSQNAGGCATLNSQNQFMSLMPNENFSKNEMKKPATNNGKGHLPSRFPNTQQDGPSHHHVTAG